MPFTPQSKVYVGKVPWSNDYSHVRRYSNTTAQYNDILDMCDYTIPNTNYTYVRMNNSIKVMGNADKLYYCNYVMYKNDNFPSMWVYAFIVECNYINDNTTELVLETDIWQTYCFGMSFANEVFIERYHPSTDELYANTVPEPNLVGGDLWLHDTTLMLEIDDFKPDCIMVATTADVEYNASSVPTARVDIYGALYGGIPCGAALYAFDVANANGDEYSAYRFIWDLNKVGAGDAVSDIYLYPSAFLSSTDAQAPIGNGHYHANQGNFTGAWGSHRLYKSTYLTYKDYTVPYPSNGTLHDYTPRNKKLLSYPFTFCRVTAPTGQYIDLKYEYWYLGTSEDSGYVPFILRAWVGLLPDGNAVIVPRGYAGLSPNMQFAISFPVNIRGSWQFGAYSNWSAQHAVANAIEAASDIAMMAIPIPQVKGAGAAVKALGAGYKATKAGIAGSKALQGSALARQNFASGMMDVAGAKARSALSVGAQSPAWANPYTTMYGINALGNLAGDISYQTMQPNAFRGSMTSSNIYSGRQWTYQVKVEGVHMMARFLRIYDDFFDMFGYAYNRIGYVGSMTRPLWCYWKTDNASLRPRIGTDIINGAPAYAVAAINAMFDNGVTMWNVTDGFGDYDYDNNRPT